MQSDILILQKIFGVFVIKYSPGIKGTPLLQNSKNELKLFQILFRQLSLFFVYLILT